MAGVEIGEVCYGFVPRVEIGGCFGLLTMLKR